MDILDKWNSNSRCLFDTDDRIRAANEIYAHSPDDQCPIDHLVKAAAMYALLPLRLSQ